MTRSTAARLPDPVPPTVARGQVPQPVPVKVKVWDLPTRLFHWSLVAAVVVAIVTAKVGGPWMALHGQAGLAVVGLVAFRLVWGVIGPTHARFLSFLPTPSRVLAYLRGRWQGTGHNPLGAVSVIVLLAVLGTQAALGLFSDDEIDFAGPLRGLVDDALAGRMTGWHHDLSNVLLGFIGLHLAAIAFYAWVRKDRLVGPMVTGWKRMARGTPTSRVRPLALVVALVVAAAAVYVAGGGLLEPEAAPVVPAAPATDPAGQQPAEAAVPSW